MVIFLPQMAPMWWTTLMIMFLLSMYMCMQTLYFYMNKPINKQNKKMKKKFTWSW